MDLIDRDKLMKDICKWLPKERADEFPSFDENIIISTLMEIEEQPTVEAVPNKAYDFIKWERDIAISQLESYGVQLGEKANARRIVYCEDCKYSDKKLEKEHSVYCVMLDRPMSKVGFCSFGDKLRRGKDEK